MAVSDAYVLPGFLTPVQTELSLQSHGLLFSYASEVRGKNTPERKFALRKEEAFQKHCGKEKTLEISIFSLSNHIKQMFSGVYWNQPVCPSVSVSVCVLNTCFCQSADEY